MDRRKETLVAAALLALLATSVEAQTGEGLAFAALVGRHALEAGIEVSPVDRIALVGRAGGFPQEIAGRSVAGAGVRFDPFQDPAGGRVYVMGLAGWLKCNLPALDGPTECADDSWQGAWAGLAGVEIRLGADSPWFAGIEAGYWSTTSSEDEFEGLSHLTFAAGVRLRPRFR